MDQKVIVTEDSSQLRLLARQALSGKWGNAVLGTLIYAVLIGLPNYIFITLFDVETADIVNMIFTLIVGGPLVFGYFTMILNIFRGFAAKPSDTLKGFEQFGKAFMLFFLVQLFIFLWVLIGLLPMFILIELSFISGVGYALAILFLILGVVLGVIAYYRYSMAWFITFDNPGISAMNAIRASKALMDGNKAKLFLLDLSFIGWALLSAVFTLGIGFLWVMPYSYTANAAFYEIAAGRLRMQPLNAGYGAGQQYGTGGHGGYRQPGQGTIPPLYNPGQNDGEGPVDSPVTRGFSDQREQSQAAEPSVDKDETTDAN